jgi:DNA-directed RNA polymerase
MSFVGLKQLETQATIEAQALAEGAERWLQKAGDAAERGLVEEDVVVIRTIRESMGLVTEALRVRRAELDAAGGHETLSKAVLRDLPTEKIAYAALLATFNAAINMTPLRDTCINIAGLLEVELLTGKVDADAVERIGLIARRSRSGKARMKAARKLLRDNAKEATEAWTREEKTKIGSTILDVVMRSMPEFQTFEDEDGVVCITFESEAATWLSGQQAKEAWLHPLSPCMVVPPLPWTGVYQGGYLDGRLQKLRPLVRTNHREQRRLVQQHIEAGKMTRFLEAINAAQDVPYTINKKVLGTQLEFKRRGIAVSKVPDESDVLIPAVPEDYDSLPEDEQKGWRLKRRDARLRNIGLRSERKVYESDLREALRYAEHERFWLPISVDFRGRMYPIPTFNYQRSDPVKALFLFANPKPLGKDGYRQLMIHAATAGDFGKVSKKSFAEREQWTRDHVERMKEVAWDPLAHKDWWSEADEPWQFLAACYEIAAVAEHGDPETYLCRLPIPKDGSNSGLQHYSALLRSYEDGAQVNLVPMSKPADVYQTVADKVAAWVNADADAGNADALLWRSFGITRSLVKRGVMTYPYGSEAFGMKQQIITDTMDPIADQLLQRKIALHPFVDKKRAKQAAGYLAKHIYRAVTQTVSKAQEGMTYLKKVAALLAHERKPVTWTTPLGFPVLHKYQDPHLQRVKLFVSDRRIDVVVADGYKETINKVSARNAVSPNVIHSCDASHVRRVVLAAKAEGITDYLLIHDSFATHACDVARFSEIIREQLVSLYEGWDPLQAIYDTAWAQLSPEGREKLPTPPQKGTLDLKLILRSEYAFA